jgi:hypothetical protein
VSVPVVDFFYAHTKLFSVEVLCDGSIPELPIARHQSIYAASGGQIFFPFRKVNFCCADNSGSPLD